MSDKLSGHSVYWTYYLQTGFRKFAGKGRRAGHYARSAGGRLLRVFSGGRNEGNASLESALTNLKRRLASFDFSIDPLNTLSVSPNALGNLAYELAACLKENPAPANLDHLRALIEKKTRSGSNWRGFLSAALSLAISPEDVRFMLDLADMAKTLEQAHDECGVHTLLNVKVPEFYWPAYRLAVHAWERGEHEYALVELTRVTEMQPDFAWGWFHRGLAEGLLTGAGDGARSMMKAIELANDDALNILIHLFDFLAKMPWDAKASDTLVQIMSYKSFADSDLERVMSGLVNVVSHDPQALNAKWMAKALKSDIATGYTGRQSVVTWWPIHLMVAFCAIDANDPLALDTIRSAANALRISTSRNKRRAIFETYLHKSSVRLLKRLALRDDAVWGKRLIVELLELCEMFIEEFSEIFLSKLILDMIRVRRPQSAEKRRLEQLELRIVRGAHSPFDFKNHLILAKDGPHSQNSSLFHMYVDAQIALSGEYGLDMLVEVENILHLIEISTILSAQDRYILCNKLFNTTNDAFYMIYNHFKSRAQNGALTAEADTWDACLRRVVEIIIRIENLKHLMPEDGMAKVTNLRPRMVILTSPYIPQVRTYRAEQFEELLGKVKFECEIYDLNLYSVSKVRALCAGASLVLFQRQPATPSVLSLMSSVRAMGGKVLYDIDDLIFDLAYFPPPLSDYEANIDRETFVHLAFDCAMFKMAIDFADEIIVSTEPLRRRVRAILTRDKPIHLRRNFVGAEVNAAAGRSLKKIREPQKTVRIFYGSGTKAHKSYFMNTVIPALVTTLKTYSHARLVLVGHFPEIRLFSEIAERVDLLKPNLTFPGFLDLMSGYDINIAPLDITEATNAKSELKWFEAAAVGLPSIVSPTQNYRDVVEDGYHVLFADTQMEWESAFGRLIQDAQLRQTLVSNSRDLMAHNYTPEYWAQQTVESGLLTSHVGLIPTNRMPMSGKKRLLVVNTYFWPESIGGATRVAESYVDDLYNRYSDEFEIFVLCASSNPTPDSDYGIDTFWYRGVLVTQVDVPSRDWADALDPRVETLVTELARNYSIDVAHLHSIQILTASVAQALQTANIPVLLTLHDGWWLSEHQFLVDDGGNPFLPTPDASEILETVTYRMNASERLERRNLLHKILTGCTRVVAVSEQFAKVYKNAGFMHIGVHENGINPIRIEIFRQRPKNKVRLGFIGGRADHKGYGLLLRTLTKLSLPNLELIEVDHAQPYGYEREGRIGDTRTITLGKFPQDRVTELYSRFDVLVAISIWPESYGLVSREARFAGLPVIVGNKGDIGRGVKNEVDGWIVDIDNIATLEELLLRLNAHPEIADIKPRDPQFVSVSDAVNELVQMLRKITWQVSTL